LHFIPLSKSQKKYWKSRLYNTPQRDAALGNTSLWFVFRGNIEAQGFFLFFELSTQTRA
jgi:hypothetical protein